MMLWLDCMGEQRMQICPLCRENWLVGNGQPLENNSFGQRHIADISEIVLIERNFEKL